MTGGGLISLAPMTLWKDYSYYTVRIDWDKRALGSLVVRASDSRPEGLGSKSDRGSFRVTRLTNGRGISRPMGEQALAVSWGWEVQRRKAICDGRGTLSIGRAACLPLGGRVARKKKGSWQREKIFSRERY
ncbi:hypothetical protein TNCV_4234521 [Trichonephila clavipes]|nr:hypothetical protein TNCV_4234521 [Trichonephila clavipes]